MLKRAIGLSNAVCHLHYDIRGCGVQAGTLSPGGRFQSCGKTRQDSQAIRNEVRTHAVLDCLHFRRENRGRNRCRHPPEFQGRVESFAGTEVLFGALNGATANTLNLAIFSLHSAGSASVTRLEINNLDQQQRPSDSHPVYWLGHATKDESLNDVRQLAESGQSTEVRAQATLAIALHDDPQSQRDAQKPGPQID